MHVNFETNSYLNALEKKLEFNIENKILEQFKTKGLQFTYADVTLKEFNQAYSQEGWHRRKVIALPAIIWTGVIKTILHLFHVIIGFFNLPYSSPRNLQVELFRLYRNFEELYGWLVSIINDQQGQYHIQQSEFHKSCYTYLLTIERKEASIKELVKDHLSKDYLSAAINTIQEISIDHKSKEATLLQIAETYLQKNKPEKSLNAIIKITDDTVTKEDFILKVTNYYLENDRLEDAFKAVENISIDLDSKDSIFANIAKTYLLKDNLTNTLETIKKIRDNNHMIENPKLDIPEIQQQKQEFFRYRSIEDTFTTHLSKNESKIEKIITEIAHTCLTKRLPKFALKVILMFSRTIPDRHEFLMNLAQFHHSTGNEDDTLEAINEIVKDAVATKVLVNTPLHLYLSYIKHDHLKDALEKFFADLALACYTHIKDRFSSLSSLSITHEIEKKASDNEVIEGFLQLILKKYLEIAKKQLSESKPKEALDTLFQIQMESPCRDECIKQIAEVYLNNQAYEEALHTIDKIRKNTKMKEDFIIKVTKIYIEAHSYIPALEALLKIADKIITENTGNKNDLTVQIAQGLFESERFSDILATIDLILNDDKAHNSVLLKFATRCLSSKNHANAFEAISKIRNDDETKENFILEIAKDLLTLGEYDMALSAIKRISIDVHSRNLLFAEIAHAYLNQQNSHKALIAIQNIITDDQETILKKDALLLKLTEHYLSDQNYCDALESLKMVKVAFQESDALILTIANAYYDQRKSKCALDAILMLVGNEETKLIFLIKLARFHYLQSLTYTYAKEDLLKIINHMVLILLENQKILSNITINNAPELSHKNLINTCYQTTKKHFENNPNEPAECILNNIIEIIKNEKNLDKSLN